MNRVILSTGYFPDPTKGVPISSASIYIGEPDTDPEVVLNQKTIFILQEDGSVVSVAQPLLTGAGGVPLYNGSPVTILVDGLYSIKVNDSNGAQIYYVPTSLIDDFSSVDTFHQMFQLTPDDGDLLDVTGFFFTAPQVNIKGGGRFIYQSGLDKSNADGGLVVDPDNTGGFDGTLVTRDAFLAAQGFGVGTGCWVRLGYEAITPYFYGAQGVGGDEQLPLQTVINQSIEKPVHIQSGHYQYQTLYFYYDAVTNPEYPSESLSDERRIIYGDGPLGRQNFINNIYRNGTLLECTLLTGDGLKIGNGTSSGERIALRDLAIWGNTTGTLVDINYCPKFSTFDNLFIGNLGDGVALKLRDVWTSNFSNIDIHGDSSTPVGVGLFFDNNPATSSAGLNTFSNITTSSFETGQQWGNIYNASNKILKGNTLTGLQSRNCTYGINFYDGFSALVSGLWTEGNTTYAVNVAENADALLFDNCFLVDTAVTEGTLVLGKPTGTDNNKRFESIKISGTSRIFCGTAGIRKYAYSEAPLLYIENTVFTANGGFGIQVDTTDLGNIVFGPGVDLTLFSGDGLRVGSGTIGTATEEYQFVRSLSPLDVSKEVIDISVDYSGLKYLPDFIRSGTISNAVTIFLPNDRASFEGWNQEIAFTKPQAANTFTIDAGTGNDVKGLQTYVMTAAYTGIRLRPRDVGSFIRWDVVGEW